MIMLTDWVNVEVRLKKEGHDKTKVENAVQKLIHSGIKFETAWRMYDAVKKEVERNREG